MRKIIRPNLEYKADIKRSMHRLSKINSSAKIVPAVRP